MKSVKEIERIKDVYKKRKINISEQIYSYFNDGNFFIIQTREKEIIGLLKKCNITSLNYMKILDVGCGEGGELRSFMKYGALPENLYGVDILTDRINRAKYYSPNINTRYEDASSLRYENASFDIVIQSTVFTSILDKQIKKNIAQEMLRVLKSDGIIIWYDFHINNPRNPDVQGVKRDEIYELFQDCNIRLKRVTLAPPIARVLAPRSWFACYLLESLKILNTHYIGIIQKKN